MYDRYLALSPAIIIQAYILPGSLPQMTHGLEAIVLTQTQLAKLETTYRKFHEHTVLSVAKEAIYL
jgi:hypothetical protein